MTRQDFIKKEERKRSLVSSLSTLIVLSLALGTMFILDSFVIQDISEFSGPVLIRLGTENGIDTTSKVIESALDTPKAEAVPETKSEETNNVVETQKESPKPTVAEKAKTETVKDSTASNLEKKETSPSTNTQNQDKKVETKEKITSFKGSENGNSWETQFGSTEGRIARSLYVPIYLYMPLPLYIDQTVGDNIAAPGLKSALSGDERRKIFADYYKKEGLDFMLKNPVALDYRPQIWLVLEDAGYNIAKADYKENKSLNSVIIQFTIEPGTKESQPKLTNFTIAQGSGYKELDDAVLYGFKQATFSSDSLKTLSGRFTYRFTN